ncbi:hypothetical protein C5S32_00290 [ANME-1 cluster archaeon GoMg1]|nr:hypothetical protein [ANME-1 cluster archaeon GoMg1]
MRTDEEAKRGRRKALKMGAGKGMGKKRNCVKREGKEVKNMNVERRIAKIEGVKFSEIKVLGGDKNGDETNWSNTHAL